MTVLSAAIIADATGRTVNRFGLSQGTTQKDPGSLSDEMYQVIYEYEMIRFTREMTIQY